MRRCACDIANKVVRSNAETAKETEDADLGILARSIHVLVGCILAQRVAMTAGIMLLKWVRHPGPELSHAASIGRVCQSLRND